MLMCTVRTLRRMTDHIVTDHARAPADSRYAEIQHRWRELSACASGIVPARIPLEPAPGEIEMVADDLRVLARKVDALVEAYGDYVDANAPGIDLTLFKDALFNAMDGNALYEIEQASQQLRDDHRERAYTRATIIPARRNDMSSQSESDQKTDASTDLSAIEAPPAPWGAGFLMGTDEGKKLRPCIGSACRSAIHLGLRSFRRMPIELSTLDYFSSARRIAKAAINVRVRMAVTMKSSSM